MRRSRDVKRSAASPEQWATHTHVWSAAVDLEHLNEVRASAGPADPLHSTLEILAYADDEAAACGRVGRAVVTITDSMISVNDDGRGTEARLAEDGTVVRKPVMSTRDVRFFGHDDAPKLPDGIPRQGMSSVSGVSELLIHANHRVNGSWSQAYRFGVPDDDLIEIPFRGYTGTEVVFSAPSARVLGLKKLRALANAFGHLRVEFIDNRTSGAEPNDV